MATQTVTFDPDRSFIYGQGPRLQSLNRLAAEIAGTGIPVLLVGESGTGKGVYASLVHRLSGASEASFIRINCGAVDAIQVLNEVYEAFQRGADPSEPSTTIYLDSVHELDAACQRALLSLMPEGDPKDRRTSLPRVIASTSADLEKEIEAGRFRHDLHYRLNGVTLWLPALRERKEDIPDLLECFSVRHANELRKTAPEIDRQARKLLFAYDWPGNIRELENIARRIVAVGDADLALSDFRNTRMIHAVESPRRADAQRTVSAEITSLKVAARAASRAAERELILKALEQTRWNRKRAARKLQVSYKSLLQKIKQNDLEAPEPRKSQQKT